MGLENLPKRSPGDDGYQISYDIANKHLVVRSREATGVVEYLELSLDNAIETLQVKYTNWYASSVLMGLHSTPTPPGGSLQAGPWFFE